MREAIKSASVLLPEKGKILCSLRPAVIYFENGKITEISENLNVISADKIIDAGVDIVMPGLCDSHVHMNEPGRTEWEGIETATRAAAAGGITTLIDMPLNSIPPTTTLEALEMKRVAAKKTARVDYGFWGGVIPGNKGDLQPLIEGGVLGFKAFMIDSGVSEFPMASEKVIKDCLPILAKYGVPLLVHAELESNLTLEDPSNRKYSHYLSSRPERWEVDAIKVLIQLARDSGCRIHVVHLSAAKALSDIEKAQGEKVLISAETCPHYLTLSAENIPDGATLYKCAPPIRDNDNREKLWQGLQNGVISFVVSDHSPCTPNLKAMETGNFEVAWGGIAGLQFSLPLIWTEMKHRNLTVGQLSYWMSESTIKFLNIKNKTGKIEVGNDADLVVWDPGSEFTVERSQILHRHDVTPYLGKKLYGVVKKTFVRGNCVYNLGRFSNPQGQEVTRK